MQKIWFKKIVVASTAAVYGNPKYLPIDENHPAEPISPYGLSKLTMEKYLELSGLNYMILRFSNVYGERQTALGEAGVISIFDYAMRNNKDVFIDGDGEQSRDFIYVKDAADIVTYLTAIPNNNEIINVSTNSLCSINQLFQKMSQIYNYNKPAIHRIPRIDDIKKSRLDNSKLMAMLNYTNFQKLEKGLQNLLEHNHKQSGVIQNA